MSYMYIEGLLKRASCILCKNLFLYYFVAVYDVIVMSRKYRPACFMLLHDYRGYVHVHVCIIVLLKTPPYMSYIQCILDKLELPYLIYSQCDRNGVWPLIISSQVLNC